MWERQEGREQSRPSTILDFSYEDGEILQASRSFSIDLTAMAEAILSQTVAPQASPTFARIARHLLGISFWLYVITKLFIFDIDIGIADRLFPNYAWVLSYKFVLISGAIATVWLFSKNTTVLSWAAYIIFYPIILLLWNFPRFVWKQQSWMFTFVVINSTLSFFSSIKYSFIVATASLVAAVIVFVSNDRTLVLAATAVLSIVLFLVYFHRFVLIFKTSNIHRVYRTVFSGFSKSLKSSYPVDTTLKQLPVERFSQQQLQTWTTNLQLLVIFDRACVFTSKKLRDYQRSGLNIVSYVLSLLALVAFTIGLFAIVNYGLYKVQPTAFATKAITAFNFLYYSFNTLFFSSIAELSPVAPLSEGLAMLEKFFAFFLGAILISLCFSVKNERHAAELDDVIKEVEANAAAMEEFIKDEYRLSIEDAIAQLAKLQAGLINIIYGLSK
jgi:hypothetical protein